MATGTATTRVATAQGRCLHIFHQCVDDELASSAPLRCLSNEDVTVLREEKKM